MTTASKENQPEPEGVRADRDAVSVPAGPQYWTIVRNEIAYTPTQAEGIYTSEAKAQVVVEAMWAEGLEAVVVPLCVSTHLNPLFAAGQLRAHESLMTELADDMELESEQGSTTTIRIESQTYRDLLKYRTTPE